MSRHVMIRSAVLLAAVLMLAAVLAGWKQAALADADAAWANQPEPAELVEATLATAHEFRPTTVAIGTVRALRSVTLSNEVAGTVREVALRAGEVVDAGHVLVALDVAVEKAELKALQARARLAETRLARAQQLHQKRAVSQEELDSAQAERDVAQAEVERVKAVIDRKTIRAPFRARVGIANVHPGQYLNAGTVLTTLQSVEESVHVDFTVTQQVAATLREGETIAILPDGMNTHEGRIVAVDSRVDPLTRNATVRARIERALHALAPGASVRVRVPVGEPRLAVRVPVNALRKGPAGDHVFVLTEDEPGQLRAHLRRVETGPMLGDEIVIRDGVQAGERVATTGSFKLREAVLVALGNDSAAATIAGGSL